jgi:hypothetical protein
VRRKRLASEVAGSAVVAAQAPLVGLRGFNPVSASAITFISSSHKKPQNAIRGFPLCNLWMLFVIPNSNTTTSSATSLFGMKIQRRK